MLLVQKYIMFPVQEELPLYRQWIYILNLEWKITHVKPENFGFLGNKELKVRKERQIICDTHKQNIFLLGLQPSQGETTVFLKSV